MGWDFLQPVAISAFDSLVGRVIYCASGLTIDNSRSCLLKATRRMV